MHAVRDTICSDEGEQRRTASERRSSMKNQRIPVIKVSRVETEEHVGDEHDVNEVVQIP